MKKNRSIEEVYNLIEDFMKNNDIDPFHLEMLLESHYGIVCRTQEEDEEIDEELENLRAGNR